MGSIEAGGSQAADIPAELPIVPEPEHKPIRNGQDANGRGRFGSTIDDLTSGHALALVADGDCTFSEINVRPSKAADFTTAQAHDDAQGEGEAVPVDVQCRQICPDMVIRPCIRRALHMCRALDAAHWAGL